MSVKVRSTNPSEPNIVHSAHSIPLPIWRDLSWLSLLNHFHKFVVVGALLCSALLALLCFALLCSLCCARSAHIARITRIYELVGKRSSLSTTPSSSRTLCSSWRYSSYWPLFSTFALIPVVAVLVLCLLLLSGSSESFQRAQGVLAKRTLEYPDGGREVVDAPGGSESGDDDAGRRHEIVGESVVEVALQLEDVLHAFELFLVSARKETQG
jgi:hypothetical protein